MLKETVFHEDVFYAYFQPFRHPSSHFNIWGGHGLETFGEDFKIARSLHPHHVWTVLEGSQCSDQWISPGLHYVNRICYLVTRVPHADAPITFRIEGKPRPITSIGLARRMTTLRRLLDAYQASV
mgnify:FL=1